MGTSQARYNRCIYTRLNKMIIDKLRYSGWTQGTLQYNYITE